jgi:acyl dehydratase
MHTQTKPQLVTSVADLPRHVGTELGPSRTVVIDQAMIDAFGKLTGDEHWIHTDVERAARELPGKAPIAHGYLLLALITGLNSELIEIQFKRALNYGLNRVRFVAPLPVGSQVRASFVVASATDVDDGGVQVVWRVSLERQGSERPVCIAEFITRHYF